jgi:hypothetical protein
MLLPLLSLDPILQFAKCGAIKAETYSGQA